MAVNRETTNVLLPTEVSSEIWANTLEESVFMQLARTMRVPGTGVDIQTITGEPQANWVNEMGSKPVSEHTFGKKTITPYKMAVIEAFSDEFRRDKAALYGELVRRLPYALATKFDQTIIGTTAPGTGFDVLGNCTAVSLTPPSGKTMYDVMLTVDQNISNAGGLMSHIVIAPQARTNFLSATDGHDRPLFTAGVETGAINPILGAQVVTKKAVYAAGTPATLGVAGDFSKMIVATVEGIKISISDQATLGTGENAINLWQQNMFAVRAEFTIAAAIEGAGYFNLLTA